MPSLGPVATHTRRVRHATLAVGVGLIAACSTGQLDGGDSSTFASFSTTVDTTNDSATDDSHAESSSTGDTGEPEPTCGDGIANQGETDIDCGGPNCGPCGDGMGCAQNSDCVSQSCAGGMCIQPSCGDGVKNGDETDVDCGGGQCDPCAAGFACDGPSDCESGVCSGGACAQPSCGDGVKNGDETDIDCGGSACSGCLEGEDCIGPGDCLSQYCMGGQCAPADCLVDGDCAMFSSDCTMGLCNAQKTCDAAPINEGGGCDDGDLCSAGETCSAGTCGGGGAIDCSGLSNTCNVGVCNPDNGMCVAQNANEGNPCDDGKSCTVNEVCSAGACSDPNDPGYVFFEDFSDNSAGWTLATEWQIGAATTSACASSCPGNDPATDHTPTADNGVAGALLGGCISVANHTDYCLTSPVINTAVMPGSAWLSFWRHLHSDYPGFMTSSVQVYNGISWSTIWANGCCSCINDAAWSQQAFDVTNYKSANFRVRFCHKVEQAGAYNSGGWNIDDVTIAPAQCTPP